MVKEDLKKSRERNLAIFIGIIIIVIVSINSNGGYIDKYNKCKQIKGHTCSTYEIDTMNRGK